MIRLWTEIGESVAASGVKKLVLFNAHGGQVSVMDLVARDLRARLGMLVYSVSWFNLPMADAQGRDVNALFSAAEHRFGIHAGRHRNLDDAGAAPGARAHGARAEFPFHRAGPCRRPSRFWATAAAPNWAGRCRTTTRPARWVTRRRPPRTRAGR
ncbi:MAG: creatininase family protein [Candidatus Nanopelagicales bacterium]